MPSADRFRQPPDYFSSAPVGAIGRQTCWDMQRVVLRALVEKNGDRTAAREVLDVLGLSSRCFRYEADGDGQNAREISLLWGRNDTIAVSPDPHARERKDRRR